MILILVFYVYRYLSNINYILLCMKEKNQYPIQTEKKKKHYGKSKTGKLMKIKIKISK